jgi:hypothetical protein
MIGRINVTFRVIHPDADPAEISRLLDCAPTHAHRAGDPRVSRGGVEIYGYFAEGQWSLQSTSDASVLQAHVDELLRRLAGRTEGIFELKRRGYRLDLFIGIFIREGSGGVRLGADSLSQLATFGIDLDFDLYAETSD